MTRWMTVTLLVTWACAGCGPLSMVDAEEEVVLSGRFVEQDGSPVSERVSLIREPSATEIVGVVATLPAWGLYCAAKLIGDDNCLVYRYADPDLDGAYRFALMGDETQKEFGVARRLWIGVHEGDVSATVSFHAQAPDVPLPEVALWRAAPTLTVAGDDLAASWEAAAVAPGDGDAERYRLQAWTEGGGLVWSADSTATSVDIPLDAMQDVATRVRVAAESERPGPDTTFTITQYGPGVAAPAGGRTPASRGASCTYTSSRGTEEPLAPCPLTDGLFDDYYRSAETVCDDDGMGGCAGEAWQQIEIDLGATTLASRLVVHDLSGVDPTEVAVSADGASWTELGEARAFSIVSSAVPFRFVRLRVEGDARLAAVNEVGAY